MLKIQVCWNVRVSLDEWLLILQKIIMPQSSGSNNPHRMVFDCLILKGEEVWHFGISVTIHSMTQCQHPSRNECSGTLLWEQQISCHLNVAKGILYKDQEGIKI